MDIQTFPTERKNVDSNSLAVGATSLASGGVGAAFAFILLRWVLNQYTSRVDLMIELQREMLKKQEESNSLLRELNGG